MTPIECFPSCSQHRKAWESHLLRKVICNYLQPSYNFSSFDVCGKTQTFMNILEPILTGRGRGGSLDNCKFHFSLLCSHKCWVPTWLTACLLKLRKLKLFLAKCKSYFCVRKEKNQRKTGWGSATVTHVLSCRGERTFGELFGI